MVAKFKFRKPTNSHRVKGNKGVGRTGEGSYYCSEAEYGGRSAYGQGDTIKEVITDAARNLARKLTSNG